MGRPRRAGVRFVFVHENDHRPTVLQEVLIPVNRNLFKIEIQDLSIFFFCELFRGVARIFSEVRTILHIALQHPPPQKNKKQKKIL